MAGRAVTSSSDEEEHVANPIASGAAQLASVFGGSLGPQMPFMSQMPQQMPSVAKQISPSMPVPPPPKMMTSQVAGGGTDMNMQRQMMMYMYLQQQQMLQAMNAKKSKKKKKPASKKSGNLMDFLSSLNDH